MKTDREKNSIVWALCFFAALRVFIFTAAFPFFNNVDEPAHFDLVMKYSHGLIPRGLIPISADSARYLAYYHSREFLQSPSQLDNGLIPPPLWRLPFSQVEGILNMSAGQWEGDINHESLSQPLYYELAGAWLSLGRQFGMVGRNLLYWVRFLNIPIAISLVWVGFALARLVFPERTSVQIGVPLLLAFFPQDTFYSIQSDVLSPLCFGLALLYIVRLTYTEHPRPLDAAVAGASLAATYLTKAANVPFIAVVAVATLVRIGLLAKERKLTRAWPALAVFLFCAVAPLTFWLARTYQIEGTFSGGEAKIRLLGWVHKPVRSWWPHPLFTLSGFGFFWSELMSSFWRGEFVWYGKRLALPQMDIIYWASSPLLCCSAFISSFQSSNTLTNRQRWILRLSFFCFLASVAFLGILSLAFDFGRCIYPSTAFPYFVSGRLLSGALVPFLLLFVWGLDWLSGKKENSLCLTILVGLAALVTGSEILVNLPAFWSKYNWFHS